MHNELPESAAQLAIRTMVRKMAMGLVVCCIVAAAASAMVSGLVAERVGTSDGPGVTAVMSELGAAGAGGTPWSASILGVLPVLAGGLLGVMLFRVVIGRGDLSLLPAAVLGCSGARMLISIAGGLGAYFLFLPLAAHFWVGLLLAALLSLVFETYLLIGHVRELSECQAHGGRAGGASAQLSV